MPVAAKCGTVPRQSRREESDTAARAHVHAALRCAHSLVGVRPCHVFLQLRVAHERDIVQRSSCLQRQTLQESSSSSSRMLRHTPRSHADTHIQHCSTTTMS